jgi:hypothetical protein
MLNVSDPRYSAAYGNPYLRQVQVTAQQWLRCDSNKTFWTKNRPICTPKKPKIAPFVCQRNLVGNNVIILTKRGWSWYLIKLNVWRLKK